MAEAKSKQSEKDTKKTSSTDKKATTVKKVAAKSTKTVKIKEEVKHGNTKETIQKKNRTSQQGRHTVQTVEPDLNYKKEVTNGNTQKNSTNTTETDDQGQDNLQAVETTKAGKRSAKALKELEDKQAKAERKDSATATNSDAKPKLHRPPRSRLERRSKKYRQLTEQIDKTKLYDLKDAVELAVKTSPVKFDATMELHLNLNVDPRQADQNVRGTVVLPAGTGKSQRVAVFGDADEVASAKKAGADIAAGEEFLNQLDKGQLNFDVLIASPKVMPQLGKYAKVLGPKGLMPNPKSGTVTIDVAKAVSEAKAGKVEYRVDSTGIIHTGFGKVSFGNEKLLQNLETLMSSVRGAKPATIKGVYLKSGYVTSTMGPSIRIAL